MRPRRHPRVVAVGGANIDIKCRVAGRVAMGSSNPGGLALAPGGVARNIAETLARLGADARLISAVGDDDWGRRLLAETKAAGVDVRGVLRAPGRTGSYAAVLDAAGELIVGVAAMATLDRLTPRRLAARRALMEDADLVVADGNLAPATLDWLIGWTAARGLRLALEAVSVPKGGALTALLAPGRPLFALFCNRAEAAALTGRSPPRTAARRLHALGVANVCIGLGRRGMLVSSRDGRHVLQRRVPALPADVIDATGAGDAAVAGTLFGLLRGEPLATAARFGQAAAALTLASARSVSPRLTAAAVARCMRRWCRPRGGRQRDRQP